ATAMMSSDSGGRSPEPALFTTPASAVRRRQLDLVEEPLHDDLTARSRVMLAVGAQGHSVLLLAAMTSRTDEALEVDELHARFGGDLAAEPVLAVRRPIHVRGGITRIDLGGGHHGGAARAEQRPHVAQILL